MINGTQSLTVVDNDCEINSETSFEAVNYTNQHFINSLISRKSSERDPLLAISNETFVMEKMQRYISKNFQ